MQDAEQPHDRPEPGAASAPPVSDGARETTGTEPADGPATSEAAADTLEAAAAGAAEAASVGPQATLIDGDSGTISIHAYWAAHPNDRKTIVPARPGVYVWTYNVDRLLGGDELTVEERLQNLLKIVGRRRDGAVGPYTRVHLTDERKSIHPAKRSVLHQRLAAQDPFGRWVAAMANVVQRPLYVGMATDLRQRIGSHISGQSKLKAYVEDP